MQQRDRQRVGVVATLVGMQDTAAGVHQPGGPGAAVSVRVGRALIYMHEPETVAKFLNSWLDLTRESRRLPREFSPALVAPVTGMREPAVVVNASGSPPASGTLVHPKGDLSFLRLQIGRIVFEIRDLGAYASGVAVFRRAQALAPTAFPHLGPAPRREQALQDAARAFPTPREARRYATPGRAPRTPSAATEAAPAPNRAAGPAARTAAGSAGATRSPGPGPGPGPAGARGADRGVAR